MRVIKSLLDLPIDKLNELEKKEKIDYIEIVCGTTNTIVNVNEYKQIYKKMLELTDGIREEWSQTKKFVLIYNRVRKIMYDHIAGYPEKGNWEQKEYSEREKMNCRNLKNGLLLNKCVCAGYANILMHACLLKRGRAIYVTGPTGDEVHAWNQILIDEGWIEVDATWDHESGTEYIGTDREGFWKRHGRFNRKKLYQIISGDEKVISNFDLTAFINKEFELNMINITKKEQKEFIELLDKRDAQELDISNELEELLGRIRERTRIRQEFEEECGYTIEQLEKMGFDDTEIEKMECKFNGQTGERIDRKEVVSKYIKDKTKERQEFEEECGYTIEQLEKIGFDNIEIEEFQTGKFDVKTGERLDRKKIVVGSVKDKREYKDKYVYTTLTTKEKNNLKQEGQGLHPEIFSTLIKYIERGYISLEEADDIILYKKNDNSVKYKGAVDKIKKNVADWSIFEKNIGYTIAQLKKDGFNYDEIKQIKRKYIESIEMQEFDAIIPLEITLQEIGKSILEDFKKNPERAEKVIGDLEQGIKISKRTNDEIIQGED